MAYDADPAATHNPATGVVVPVNWLDLINANFAAIGAAWTSYTPTWSGTTGNGTVTGAYRKIGRTVDYRISVVWGSTTSHAAAEQTLTLPAAPHAFYVASFPLGVGIATNSGVEDYSLTAMLSSGSTLHFNNDATAGNVTNAVPFTFGTADSLAIIGTYEAAS